MTSFKSINITVISQGAGQGTMTIPGGGGWGCPGLCHIYMLESGLRSPLIVQVS